MIITRKIELTLEGSKEEKEYTLSIIKEAYKEVPRLSNLAVTEIFLNDLMVGKVARALEGYEEGLKEFEDKVLSALEDIKENNIKIRENKKKDLTDKQLKNQEAKKKKLLTDYETAKKKKNKYIGDRNKEARDLYKDGFGDTVQNSVYKKLRYEAPHLSSDIASIISAELNSYSKNIWKIKLGMERIKMFSIGMPIPVKSSSIKMTLDKGETYIKWNSNILKLRFGQDKNNNKIVIDRILDGTYKLCNSKVQYIPKKNKIFLLACIDIPEKENKFREGRILGVDLGIKYPVYYSVNNSEEIRGSIGSYEDFFRVRTQMQSRKKRLQANLKNSSGGSGRKKKMSAMKQFENKERLWARTYNHAISKGVIDAALKNECGVIAMEDLTKTGFDKDSIILRNWSYYELTQFIEYKAIKEGIEVIKVDPSYTSQGCSKCSHIDKENRQTQERFKCTSCGYTENADYNASKNISRRAEGKF